MIRRGHYIGEVFDALIAFRMRGFSLMKRIISICLFICIVLVLGLSTSAAQNKTENLVVKRVPNISAVQMHSIAYGNEIYVAVGDFGTIKVSKNGTDWNETTAITPNLLYSVVNGYGRFVAVGLAGTVLESKDAKRWHLVSMPLEAKSLSFNKVIWDGKQYTAFAYDYVGVSKDGLTWKKYSLQGQRYITDAVWNGKLYMGVGNGIFRSEDGIHWSGKITGDRMLYYSQIFSAEKNIIIPELGISTDGVKWNAFKFEEGFQAIQVLSMDRKLYVLGVKADSDGQMRAAVSISIDGQKWDTRFIAIKSWPMDVLYNGKQFVFIGYGGTIAISDDGLEWKTFLNDNRVLSKIVWDGKQYLACGSGEDNIYLSKDGESWSNVQIPICETDEINDAVWFKNQYILITQQGNILTSEDGHKWTLADQLPKNIIGLSHIAYKKDSIIISGWTKNDDRFILRSQDGKRWTQVMVDGFYVCNEGKYYFNYYSGYKNGKVFRSEDGVKWTPCNISQKGINAIKFIGKNYVAVASDGVYTSKDAVRWKKTVSDGFDKVLWNGSEVLVIGNMPSQSSGYSTNIMISKDGVHWKTIKCDLSNLNSPLTVFCYKNSFIRFLSSGVESSQNGIDWHKISQQGTYGGDFILDMACSENGFVAVGQSRIMMCGYEKK